MTFQLPFGRVAPTGTLQLLHGAQNASNTPEGPELVTPVNSTITTGKNFNFTAPGFSVSVLTIKVA